MYYLKQKSAVDGRVQVTIETVAVDAKLPVEDLRLGHVARRAGTVSAVSVAVRRVGEVHRPQPRLVVVECQPGAVERSGKVDADHRLCRARPVASRRRRREEGDVATVSLDDAVHQVDVDLFGRHGDGGGAGSGDGGGGRRDAGRRRRRR